MWIMIATSVKLLVGNDLCGSRTGCWKRSRKELEILRTEESCELGCSLVEP